MERDLQKEIYMIPFCFAMVVEVGEGIHFKWKHRPFSMQLLHICHSKAASVHRNADNKNEHVHEKCTYCTVVALASCSVLKQEKKNMR